MLPSPDLEPAYDKVTWLYVYQDFSGSPRDEATRRITLRLGTTSWPQHLLVDPETFAILDSTGRTVETFLAAVRRTRVAPEDPAAAAVRLQLAEDRARRLLEKPSVKLARKLLEDADPVVRYLALELLATKQPEQVSARAPDLLQVPHDPTRYLVCQALQEQPNPKAAPILAQLARDPGESRNPNVVRIRAVQALGACGRPEDVEAIDPLATSGEARNSLTRLAVEALANIARRHRQARPAVRDVLLRAYPEPPPAEPDPTDLRVRLQLARTVHQALRDVTGRKVDFPDPYDAEQLERARRAWSR